MSAESEQARVLEHAAAPLLDGMEIDAETIIKVTPLLGRNISGRFDFINGAPLFVKVLRGLGAGDRFTRSISFSTAAAHAVGFSTPDLVGHDQPSRAVAHEFLADGARFGEIVRDNQATLGELARAGAAVAGLHSMHLADPTVADRTLPPLPPHGLNAIALDLFEGSTVGQLEMWRIIQGDTSLRADLDQLALPLAAHEVVPIHGDLRSDQLLMSEDNCWILDWEEFRLGDAARDVGSMAGELLYHRMRLILDGLVTGGEVITDEMFISRGAEIIETVSPSLRAFWEAYCSRRGGDLSDEFTGRTVRFLGWQLFDRALASATYFGRMSALDRALAGIGREAIRGGANYAGILGFEAA